MEATAINLLRRPDRRAALRAFWAAAGMATPLRIQRAVDGALLAGQDPFRRACRASHLQALRAAAGPLLVLEDDAIFQADLAATVEDLLARPPAAGLVFLGGEHTALPTPCPDRRFIRLGGRMRGSHAYFTTDPAALAEHLQSLPGVDVDAALSQAPGALALPVGIVGQTAGWSDITAQMQPARYGGTP